VIFVIVAGIEETVECPFCGNVLSITRSISVIALLPLIILLANTAVCVVVGWTAIRAGGFKLPGLVGGEGEEEEE